LNGSDRALEVLEELLSWTRFSNRAAFVDTIGAVMNDPRHLIAYEATDGHRSQGEVAASAGLSQPTVSSLWARWRRLGLVVGPDRPRHLARPSDLGIEIPPVPATPSVGNSDQRKPRTADATASRTSDSEA
jgi:hypothetical protein